MTCLLDNHLLIDPVTALIPDRSEEHHELRRRIRAPIFEQIRKQVLEGATILMTACLAGDNGRDAAFLSEHFDIVRGTDIPIIWVNADCDPTILEQRLESPERCQGSRAKLTDVRVLRDLLREHHLIEPTQSADRSIRLVVKQLDVNGPVDLSASHLIRYSPRQTSLLPWENDLSSGDQMTICRPMHTLMQETDCV
ncbi:uncharacterized protein TRIREDRAFT_106676 [Trichoderma reesei QM6a]|uniref:Predicted protein n=1 Tax=Hypocrea jecorina (strain QM6a) TaxID=431241 RepID=G0RH90_HYPJQ|nr:uncharacterized protein TRIREDRAFT_106676 [Trichoderma reesei QM6a]EGR49666.1 predicted protein [Trichoderma reesei QM6a]